MSNSTQNNYKNIPEGEKKYQDKGISNQAKKTSTQNDLSIAIQDKILQNAELENMVAKLFFWARRYAHGRQTYLPDTIRRIYKTIQEKYPSIHIPRDETIKPPTPNTGAYMHFRDDYLDDINL